MILTLDARVVHMATDTLERSRKKEKRIETSYRKEYFKRTAKEKREERLMGRPVKARKQQTLTNYFINSI